MNAVDEIQLGLLLAELAQASLVAKDERVATLISQAFDRNPDAAYLLVQRVMQLESALCGARAAVAWDPERLGPRDRPSDDDQREADPWWRQPVAALVGTRILLQSTTYLISGSRSGASAATG
jgi:hypothetical protein